MTAPSLGALESLPDEALVPVRWVRELVAGLDGGTDQEDEWVADLTCEDVAPQLDRTPACIRGWCRSGKLPGAYRLHGREWRIPVGSLRAYLAEQGRAS